MLTTIIVDARGMDLNVSNELIFNERNVLFVENGMDSVKFNNIENEDVYEKIYQKYPESIGRYNRDDFANGSEIHHELTERYKDAFIELQAENGVKIYRNHEEYNGQYINFFTFNKSGGFTFEDLIDAHEGITNRADKSINLTYIIFSDEVIKGHLYDISDMLNSPSREELKFETSLMRDSFDTLFTELQPAIHFRIKKYLDSRNNKAQFVSVTSDSLIFIGPY